MALHFVKEPRTRFRLALACGNIEAAMESAFALEQQQQPSSYLNPGGTPKDPSQTTGRRDVWGELALKL